MAKWYYCQGEILRPPEPIQGWIEADFSDDAEDAFASDVKARYAEWSDPVEINNVTILTNLSEGVDLVR